MIVLLTLSESGAGCTPVDVAKLTQEFCNAVMIAQKYDLLKNYKKLHKDDVFPTQYLGGCNGSFWHAWLSDTLGWFTVSR